MKELAVDWEFYWACYLIFLIFLKTMLTYQNWVLEFLRTMFLNLKICYDNHSRSGHVSNNCPTLKKTIVPREVTARKFKQAKISEHVEWPVLRTLGNIMGFMVCTMGMSI